MSFTKIDSEAKRVLLLKVQRELPFLIEFGNEDDIMAYTKRVSPNTSPEQMKRVVKLFLFAKHERARSRQSH
jgi:hypothetical protein